MFCFQCQETAKGEGCKIKGVCGKTPEVANLQDLLIFLLKGLSKYTTQLRELGEEYPKANHFIMNSLFMTITNANFDKERFIKQINELYEIRKEVAERIKAKNKSIIFHENCDCMTWEEKDLQKIEDKAAQVGILTCENEDVRSLRELITYGLKGMAAYIEHAANLKYEDVEIFAFMQRALVAISEETSVEELIKLTLECGQFGVKAMALLDKANTSTFGNPEITKVILELGIIQLS